MCPMRRAGDSNPPEVTRATSLEGWGGRPPGGRGSGLHSNTGKSVQRAEQVGKNQRPPRTTGRQQLPLPCFLDKALLGLITFLIHLEILSSVVLSFDLCAALSNQQTE